MKCPSCRSSNPAKARFCSNCGRALGTLPAEGSAAGDPSFKLDRYIPPELAARLQAARAGGHTAGERRVITCLFCDVSGSTAAAERLDPEEWAEIINGAFERMIRPIYRYEGMVARLMGDAILAFFGAPIGHEDDPQRAVLAALEIQAGMEPYRSEVHQRLGIDFSLRVGINTGLVVVGEIGSDLRMEYTAIGDAINLAARMEQTTAPGSIQISAGTHKLVAPFFECEALGELQIKGKSAPVSTYRVLGVSAAPGQLRGLEGLSSPLVGREADLSMLVERLRALQQGRGAIVSIVGEAGLGKSTLVAEARRHFTTGDDGTWLEGQALSYTRSISYYPWRQIIRTSIGARENDSPAEVREKLRYSCECCDLPGGDLPFLEAMLAVESEASLKAVTGYQGESLLRRITEAARGYICGLAAESPLVISFDDLHWADEASLTLLASLVDLVEQNRLVFICMLRPESEAASWKLLLEFHQRVGDHYDQISLEPLNATDSLTLLGNLLGLAELPPGLRQPILERAEGNPFFVEEIIRALVETGQLVRGESGWSFTSGTDPLALPDTLAGLLSARIDHLPEAARQVLQTAAVIGRSFELPLLEELLEGSFPPAEQMPQLLGSGLVIALPDQNDWAYSFRHALVQEAAYGSILLKRRRQLHLRAGEFLEKSYADRIEEFAALIAGHFHSAGDARSLRYDALAGDTAARLYASAEAATHYGRALETALRIEADVSQLAELYSQRGEALEQSGRYEQALENYTDMGDFAGQNQAHAMELSAWMALARIHSTLTAIHNPALAEQMLARALELAARIGDQATQTRLHWNLMLTYLFSKRLSQAGQHGERALELARKSEDREQLAFILNDLSRVHTCLGHFEQAHLAIHQARELWRALDNQAMLADSLGAEAETCHAEGKYGEMEELLRQALQINEKIENLWGQSYARILLSLAHFDRGESDLAIEMASEGIRLGDLSGLLASSIGVRCDLAWMYGQYGATEKGLALAGQALEIAEAKQPAWRALASAVQVRLHLLHGDLSAAEAVAALIPLESISIPYPHYTILLCLANVELALARDNHEEALRLADDLLGQVSALTRPGIPEILKCKAAALAGLGRLEQATATLQEARSRATQLGASQDAWVILAALAVLQLQRGDGSQADASRAEAAGIAAGIAARLAVGGLRESFLARPEVRALSG